MPRRAVLALLAASTILAACGGSDSPPSPSGAAAAGDHGGEGPKTVRLDSGVVIEDIIVGRGRPVKEGDAIIAHATGRLAGGDRKRFWSTYERGEPMRFELVRGGGLIDGWIDGIPGMRVGGKRRIIIPYRLAYGEAGNPRAGIPPRRDLEFLFEVQRID